MNKLYSTRPTLYLYSRVSDERQAQGRKSGIHRQTESDLVDKVKAKFSHMPFIYMSDPGASGYHGTNIDKGELGDFIRLCENGGVAQGSILAMEELDRFTRLGISRAQILVNTVLTSDVKIYLWNKGKLLAENDLHAALDILLELQGAHAYSKKISKRVTGTALDKVKAILGAERKPDELCPAVGGFGHTKWWADISDGFVRPHPYYWPIAKEMIQLTLEGMGHMKMREYLSEKYESPRTAHNKNKTGWGANITRTFHSSEALLGVKRINIKEEEEDGYGNKIVVQNEYVIPDYYPPLCDLETFEKMAAIKQKNRTNKAENKATGIFTGIDICRCGFCGLTINTFRSKCGKPNETFRYKCAGMNTRITDCQGKTVDSKIIETAVIKMIGIAICQPAPVINNKEKFEIERTLEKVEAGIKNVVDTITVVGSEKELTDKFKKLKGQKEKLEAKLDEIYRNETVEIDIENPINYLTNIPPEVLDYTKNDARFELKEKLRTFVKAITVKITDKLCDIKIVLKNGVELKGSAINLDFLVYRNSEELYHKSEEHGGLSTLWFAERWYGVDRHGNDFNLMSDEYIE
ncbi:MAG: recombinase family protein, partial [Colwellia sp.]|nr:recombinase family protein [Colwellia sp.]